VIEESRAAARRRRLTASASIAAASASIAAGAVLAFTGPAWAAVLLVASGAALVAVLRRQWAVKGELEDLESVYAFTSTVDRDADTDQLVGITLKTTLGLVGGDFGEIVMSRGVGSAAICLSGRNPLDTRPARPEILDALVSDEAAEISQVFRLADAPEPITDHYRERGLVDGMAARLTGGAGTGALFVVGTTEGAVEYTGRDLRLFGAISRQARSALERARLVERLRHEARQKEHQALHDALTGLPNRLHFTIVIEDALRRARDADGRVAVLLVDLDRFKEVNDTLGHQLGDTLLQEMALRLSEVAGGEDLLARLGGDEFGIVVRDLDEVSDAVAWARRIGTALHRPFMHEGLAIQISGSIGIALAPDHGMDGVTLLRRADVAMYEAKSSGASFEVYEPQRDTYSTRRLAMAAELRAAIEEGDIQLHYQPKARLSGGDLVGVEALARWTHPRHGNVPPDEFVELAERTGLIGPLTEHVLRVALRDQKRMRWDGRRLGVAINVAATSLQDEDFTAMVSRVLHEFDAEPQTITFEVTETTMMTDSARARLVLSELDEMGLRLSIDDFGTGYSSLSYLSSLPVDEVKIDRSFVMRMAMNERQAKIVSSTTALVHSLDLSVVAEGVENETTWNLLEAAGCDVAQGFWLGRPMPIGELVAWIEAGAAPTGERDTHGSLLRRTE
jgi:diguanylate cyclase (GGDEF)-like protein